MFCYPFPLLFSGERKKKRSGGGRRKEAPFPFIFTPSSSSSRYCATLQIPEINRALLFAEGKYRRGFFIFGDVLYVLCMRHKIAPKKNPPFLLRIFFRKALVTAAPPPPFLSYSGRFRVEAISGTPSLFPCPPLFPQYHENEKAPMTQEKAPKKEGSGKHQICKRLSYA